MLAPILELIGYGGAIAEAVHAIYDFADFFNRVKNAQLEKALQEAGDIFAHVVVTLGIEAIFALLGKLAHKSRSDLQKRKAGNSSKKEILHFNELDYKGKQELLSSMTDKELYEVVRKNSSYIWIVEDYNLITDKNIKSIVILREDGSLNLDWPKYAGLQLETIDTIGNMKGKVYVSRSGSETGKTFGYGETIDSWYVSNYKRSIPVSGSEIKVGVMDVDKYKKVIEIINSNVSELQKIEQDGKIKYF